MSDRITTVNSDQPEAACDHPPTDIERFWSAAQSLDDVGPPPDTETTPALKRLGPPPFARGGFPLMGFLATVYEHISTHLRDDGRRDAR